MAYYPIVGTTDVSGITDSLNTTEQTPRNIADVLAQELARIAENILPPNAEDIAYDNTESGLTATNVQDAIDEVVSKQADVIADTMADLTENKTAVITDGVADFETIDGSLVKSLVVEIEPSQSGSGTPSPSNIRPISGYTQEDVTVVGKNLAKTIPYRVSGSIVFNPLSDGSISIQGISTGYAFAESYFTLKAGTYLVCNDANVSNSAQLQIRQYSDDQNLLTAYYGQHRELSLESDTEVKLRLAVNAGSTIDAIIYPMIVLSTETDLSFEPYKGKTYSTPFNQTVYGGTLDVLTGELTITHGYVDLGSLTWARSSTRDSSKYRFNASHTPLPKPTATNADVPNLYSSNYTAISPSDTYQNVTGATIANNGSIYMYDEALATATGADFKTAMNGVQLVYELATPTTIQLTPQKVKSLVGENHIMASTGDVLECKYSMLINGDDLEMLLS